MKWEREEEFKKELEQCTKKPTKTLIGDLAKIAVEDQRQCYKHVTAYLDRQLKKSPSEHCLNVIYVMSAILRLAKKGKGVNRYAERLAPIIPASCAYLVSTAKEDQAGTRGGARVRVKVCWGEAQAAASSVGMTDSQWDLSPLSHRVLVLPLPSRIIETSAKLAKLVRVWKMEDILTPEQLQEVETCCAGELEVDSRPGGKAQADRPTSQPSPRLTPEAALSGPDIPVGTAPAPPSLQPGLHQGSLEGELYDPFSADSYLDMAKPATGNIAGPVPPAPPPLPARLNHTAETMRVPNLPVAPPPASLGAPHPSNSVIPAPLAPQAVMPPVVFPPQAPTVTQQHVMQFNWLATLASLPPPAPPLMAQSPATVAPPVLPGVPALAPLASDQGRSRTPEVPAQPSQPRPSRHFGRKRSAPDDSQGTPTSVPQVEGAPNEDHGAMGDHQVPSTTSTEEVTAAQDERPPIAGPVGDLPPAGPSTTAEPPSQRRRQSKWDTSSTMNGSAPAADNVGVSSSTTSEAPRRLPPGLEAGPLETAPASATPLPPAPPVPSPQPPPGDPPQGPSWTPPFPGQGKLLPPGLGPGPGEGYPSFASNWHQPPPMAPRPQPPAGPPPPRPYPFAHQPSGYSRPLPPGLATGPSGNGTSDVPPWRQPNFHAGRPLPPGLAPSPMDHATGQPGMYHKPPLLPRPPTLGPGPGSSNDKDGAGRSMNGSFGGAEIAEVDMEIEEGQ